MDFSKRKQIRLKNYDYSQNGGYFVVTVCVKDRKYIDGNPLRWEQDCFYCQ